MSGRPPASSEDLHRNRGLFSDHYLDQTLPGRPGWRALAGESVAVMGEVSEVFLSYVPSANESQTEEALIRPVLRLLGHGAFEVQPALSTPGGAKRPDYVFYRDEAAMNSNKGTTLTEEILRSSGAFAVGDAKHWDRPLDVSDLRARDQLTNKNPSYQISFYLRHAGVEWGILTNGRIWRLYHRDTAHKLDVFYEADLPALLETGDPSAFLYFYAFFRRAAFDDGPMSAGAFLHESAEYARGVSDSLKSQVYEALRHLAQGFLDHPKNGLDRDDPEVLAEIYDNSLIVLYRLLFIFYAEARELLPVRESGMYRESYGLHAIKRSVAEDLDGGRYRLPEGRTLWTSLQELFGIIDGGSPSLSVATFNGGLFDPDQHPFLERHVVGGAQLQKAIDRLARVDREFVDYRDLAERHLGTIYEGLLEYHLEPADGREGWTVDLLNEKGERHRTGSYYTPDYVVEYIVEETVGPVLREAVEEREPEERAEAVLSLNVLDPAMGSGHFLVEVTEYVARFLVELGAVAGETEEAGETELAHWKRRVVQACVYGVDLNPLAVDLAKLSLWLATVSRDRPLSFLDHHLRCGNSLVGSGIPGLGTGKGKKRNKTDENQLSMLGDDAFRRSMSSAVGSIWLIEESPAASVEDVKEQEELYTRLRQDLTRRYARLADLSTAARFGVEVDPAMWPPLRDYAAGRTAFVPPQFESWMASADRVSAGQRFFHWELEFPEVFFDRHGRPLGEAAGFDAVVGNPPYVRQESLQAVKPYLKDAYPETYHGTADLYVYFYQQGLEKLRAGGRMSYIVTNKWLRASYGEPLRAYFAGTGAVEKVVDFGHAPIFPGADVFPCIVVLRKPAPGEDGERTVRVASFPREELGRTEIPDFVAEHGHTKKHSRFGREAWSLEPAAVDDLMHKVRASGVPLAEFAGAKPAYGIKTGLNEAFLIDTPTRERLVREDPRSAEVIKPYLRGQDIKRWSPGWQGLWMIFTRRGIEIDEYPAIKQHLLQYRDRLEPKPKGWSGGSWPGRKAGSYKWYEIQDSVDYWELFEQPKIIYPDITWRPSFALDVQGHISNNAVYFLPVSSHWLAAVLNSPLMWSFCWRNASHGKDEALRLFNDFVQYIPIAPPTDEARAAAEPAVERLVEVTKANAEAHRDLLYWLRVEFGVERPGRKLADFAALGADAFVEETRKRRPRDTGRLSPAALRELRDAHGESAGAVRERRAEAAGLERRLSALVNAAYGLTPDEVDLLWATAPPRMPGL